MTWSHVTPLVLLLALPASGLAQERGAGRADGVFHSKVAVEGELDLEVRKLGPDRYRATMSTFGGPTSGCGGEVEATGKLTRNVLTVTSAGESQCTLTITYEGREWRTAMVRAGEGCSFYHGAACGFDGRLTRRAKSASARWVEERQQDGFVEHKVENGASASFAFVCDVTHSAMKLGQAGARGAETTIRVQVDGPPAPAGHAYAVVDGQEFQVSLDESGVAGTDCRACAGNFSALWQALWRGKRFSLRLADGRVLDFGTEGAAEALGSRPCLTSMEAVRE